MLSLNRLEQHRRLSGYSPPAPRRPEALQTRRRSSMPEAEFKAVPLEEETLPEYVETAIDISVQHLILSCLQKV